MCIWIYENIIYRIFHPVTAANFFNCMLSDNHYCCYRRREWVYLPETDS